MSGGSLKSSNEHQTKLFLVIIVLAILQILSFIWMIDIQLKVSNLMRENTKLKYADYPDQDGNGLDPKFAKQVQIQDELKIIQLASSSVYGTEINYKDFEIIKDWERKCPNNKCSTEFTYTKGEIKVPFKGYYYVYVQMKPSRFGDPGPKKYSIQKNGKDIAIAQDYLFKNISAATKMLTRIVYLKKDERISVKIHTGGKWWSSTSVQVFGLYFLGKGKE